LVLADLAATGRLLELPLASAETGTASAKEMISAAKPSRGLRTRLAQNFISLLQPDNQAGVKYRDIEKN
jgi:hypothetical protein